MKNRIISRTWPALSGEAGFALPTVLAVMLGSLALATAAAMAAMGSLAGTNRESDSKAALAAADAGVSAALVRQNLIAGADPSSSACMYEGAGGILYQGGVEADGWCAPVTGSVNGAGYSYRTRPSADRKTFEIAATGSSQDADRRVLVNAINSGGTGVFANASLMGIDSLNLGVNVLSLAGVASNGNISVGVNSQLCGSASAGLNGTFTIGNGSNHGGGDCSESSYPSTNAALSLPGVQQGDVATNNDNCRIDKVKGVGACSDPNDTDVIGGSNNKVTWTGSGPELGKRELTLDSNTSLTLGGSNYSLCKLTLSSNSTLYVAAGSTVRLFFDSPESCGYGAGAQQLTMASNAQMTTTSTGSSGSAATSLAMLFVGSDTLATGINLNSNLQFSETCQNEFVIYAPKTDVQVSSNNGNNKTNFCGAIAGKSLDVSSNVEFTSTEGVEDFEVPGAGPHYTVDRFVECNTAAGPSPDSSC
ncbi:MAG: hypothetical protein ACR2K6_04810 [Solirubrobacterales bacterium]